MKKKQNQKRQPKASHVIHRHLSHRRVFNHLEERRDGVLAAHRVARAAGAAAVDPFADGNARHNHQQANGNDASHFGGDKISQVRNELCPGEVTCLLSWFRAAPGFRAVWVSLTEQPHVATRARGCACARSEEYVSPRVPRSDKSWCAWRACMHPCCQSRLAVPSHQGASDARGGGERRGCRHVCASDENSGQARRSTPRLPPTTRHSQDRPRTFNVCVWRAEKGGAA